MTVRTLLREVAFFAASDGFVLGFVLVFVLGFVLILNSTSVEFLKGETWAVYRTSIVSFFSLKSLRKRGQHEWRQLNVS